MSNSGHSTWPYSESNTYRTIDVGSLERRIAELEAENAALKHDIGRHIRIASPQGCVCPADAQMNCHNAACPRKPWTVTSATSQPHHPVDWSRPIGPDSWRASRIGDDP